MEQMEERNSSSEDEEDEDYVLSDHNEESGSFSDQIGVQLSTFQTYSLIFCEDHDTEDEDNCDEQFGDSSSAGKKRKRSVDEPIADVEKEGTSSGLTDVEKKKKIDELWADLRKDVKSSNISEKITDNRETVKDDKPTDPKVKKTVTRVYEFAGSEVKIEEVDSTPTTTKSINTNSESRKKIRQCAMKSTCGGLNSVLANLNKKPKLSTLSKTKIDWQSFKKEEGLEEELDQHNRSKGGFLEKQAFLQRSDLRQFELEKAIREKNRVSRQTK